MRREDNADLKGWGKMMRIGPWKNKERPLQGSGISPETCKMRMSQPFAKLGEEKHKQNKEEHGLAAGKSLAGLKNIKATRDHG